MKPSDATVLRNPSYIRWSAGAQFARLPIAMAPLAFTTLTSALTGSYATGAAMVSAVMIAEVVCSVPVGRLLDRTGITRGMRTLLVVRGLVYGGLLAAAVAGLPPVVLIAIAVLAGALGGGLLGGFRALLTGVVGERLLGRAVAINAMVVEAVIVGGPLLVALLARISVMTPVLVMAFASIIAAPLARRARAPSGTGPAGPRGDMWRPLIGWVCLVFAIGHLLSTIEVAALPLAERFSGGTAAASVIVTALCVASIAGGALYSARGRPPTRRLTVGLLVVFIGGGATVTLAPSLPVLLAGAAVAGLCTAPLTTIGSVAAEYRVPAERRAEGFAVLNTAQGLGFGLGALSLSVLPLSVVGLLGCASALVAAVVVGFTERPRLGVPVEQTVEAIPTEG